MRIILLAIALTMGAACGHTPDVEIPCTAPKHLQNPCAPAACKEDEPGCRCEGPKCHKITTCPEPLQGDAQVSR